MQISTLLVILTTLLLPNAYIYRISPTARIIHRVLHMKLLAGSDYIHEVN